MTKKKKKKKTDYKINSSESNLSECKQYHILTYLFNCYHQAILQQNVETYINQLPHIACWVYIKKERILYL